MSITVNPIEAFAGQSKDISMSDSTSVTLEARMIQAYAKMSTTFENEQNDVINQLQQSKVTSDPAELFRLQQRTSDYNLQVSMISTLTRKGVSAVETLLRS